MWKQRLFFLWLSSCSLSSCFTPKNLHANRQHGCCYFTNYLLKDDWKSCCCRQAKLDSHKEEESSIFFCDDRHVCRRSFLSVASLSIASLSVAQSAHASELGAIITKAVTTSDLGISIRKSVVKGAQIMDQIDGKWEKFSDDYGLGAARFRQGGRPEPRIVPQLKSLNIEMANTLLEISDESFSEISGISPNVVRNQIEKVDRTVKKSFERSGIDFSGEMSGDIFNYCCYIHFKAYCDIIMDMNLNWNRKAFEKHLGYVMSVVF